MSAPRSDGPGYGLGVGYALGGGLATALLIGVPTALPPRPLDRVFLILTALLCAALAATYAQPVACPTRERSLTAGGLLSFFAIGCPVRSRLAVLPLAWGGAP